MDVSEILSEEEKEACTEKYVFFFFKQGKLVRDLITDAIRKENFTDFFCRSLKCEYFKHSHSVYCFFSNGNLF